MKVRGWLVIGGREASSGLPPTMQAFRSEGEQMLGVAGTPPEAALFDPGTWLLWRPTPEVSVTLVCVEIPL